MVEWKKLGEVCEILDSQRKPVAKEERSQGIYPYYGANGIQDYVSSYIFDGTFLLMGEDGSVINKDKSPVLHWTEGRIWVNNHAHILKENERALLRYLYYSLQCTDVSDIVRGVPPKINQANMRNIPIPIPSLSEQQRIVSILDTFTSSISNLKQQIEERRKQYEYERDLLLDLEGKEGVEWKRFSEICEIKGEYGLSVPSKPFDGVRYIRITDITDDGKLNSDCVSADYNEITKVPLEEGDLLFARTGATVGKTLMYLKEYGKCLYAGYLIRYRVNREVVLPKYVFHFTHSNKYNLWVKSNLVEGAQPNINAQKYNSLEIPIPSLQEQSRIVSILDTFEQSIANLEEQQAMREKQYEYYRNQLLTFEGEEERGKT